MNKVLRKKSDNYTTISNVFLRDKNLSLKAKGFLSVVMALPNNWDFSIKGICSITKEGKAAIYGIISELRENGYCVTEDVRDEKGFYAGVDYTFYEEPCSKEDEDDAPNTTYPYTENRDTDNRFTENQPQLNKEINKELNKTKKLNKKSGSVDEFVERMYALYPPKCPMRNSSLGKSVRDKEKIKKLMRTYSESDIEFVIRNEIKKYGKSYMSNFSTFLNNFPDPTQIEGYAGANVNDVLIDSIPDEWKPLVETGMFHVKNGRLFDNNGNEVK